MLTEPTELREALAVFCTSLVGLTVPKFTAVTDLLEAGRPLGVYLPSPAGGQQMVGTAGSYTSRLVVPGGARVPQAAVTDVGVLPTHTRRGLARALIGRQLEQIAERGEIVATLRASEGTIYERFGYGIASSVARVELDVPRARLRASRSTPLPSQLPLRLGESRLGELRLGESPVRFVDPKSSWALVARIYADSCGVGVIDRPKQWWCGQELAAAERSGPQYVAVHGPCGAEDGYVRYHPTDVSAWFASRGRTIVVDDLVAHTPAVFDALLRFLLSIDLVHRLVFNALPVDHSLEKLMEDERAVRTVGIDDETWLRLVDVGAALAARSYAGSETVTIAVTDGVLPANQGGYRISGAGVQRTAAAADLSLDVSALATVYLGGTRWWQLARAGRVQEHTAGSLQIAERLFAVERAPFAGTMF